MGHKMSSNSLVQRIMEMLLRRVIEWHLNNCTLPVLKDTISCSLQDTSCNDPLYSTPNLVNSHPFKLYLALHRNGYRIHTYIFTVYIQPIHSASTPVCVFMTWTQNFSWSWWWPGRKREYVSVLREDGSQSATLTHTRAADTCGLVSTIPNGSNILLPKDTT